jgi:hypothetical protein
MTTQKVFVILYDPGYGDSKYIKGVFSSRKKALEAIKSDPTYRYSKEGLDFDIEERFLDLFD